MLTLSVKFTHTHYFPLCRRARVCAHSWPMKIRTVHTHVHAKKKKEMKTFTAFFFFTQQQNLDPFKLSRSYYLVCVLLAFNASILREKNKNYLHLIKKKLWIRFLLQFNVSFFFIKKQQQKINFQNNSKKKCATLIEDQWSWKFRGRGLNVRSFGREGGRAPRG